MKKTAIAAAILLLLSPVCKAQDLSSWAVNDFAKLSARGILSSDIVTNDFGKNITRGEFCRLVSNICETQKKTTLSNADKNVFNDTQDEAVLKAYKLGIVSGREDGGFYPSDLVTRQEMAVMMSRLLDNLSDDYTLYANQVNTYKRNFVDSAATADWAIADMAAVCANGIITGNENKMAQPLENATREQAICMLNRAYEGFVANQTSYRVPVISSYSDIGATTHRLSLEWTYTPNTTEYRVIIKSNKKAPKVITIDKNERSISQTDTGIDANDEITVYVAAYLNNGMQVFSNPLNIGKAETKAEYIQPPKETADTSTSQQKDTQQDTQQSTQQKENPFNVIEYDDRFVLQSPKEKRVFPDGHYFTTKEEALQYMVDVTVPVWTLKSIGEKVSSTKTITVNNALAEDVVNIFTEIYDDPSQFPIKDVGGFSWRNTAGGSVSQHSYGTCIDINYNENYYVKPDGTPITGSYWKPGEDPYSIAPDSIVVKTFAKYDWKWGATAWGDAYAKDYMHFTFLGK